MTIAFILLCISLAETTVESFSDFETLDKVVNLMRKTATQTGLSTTVRVMRKAYETGRHATQEFRQNMKFKLDKVLPRWNYTA